MTIDYDDLEHLERRLLGTSSFNALHEDAVIALSDLRLTKQKYEAENAALLRQLAEKERQRNTAQGEAARYKIYLMNVEGVIADPGYDYYGEYELELHDKIKALHLRAQRLEAENKNLHRDIMIDADTLLRNSETIAELQDAAIAKINARNPK